MSDLPGRMKVVDIREAGGPESLVIQERSVPAPDNTQVLVQVAAAGVNRPDILQRRGLYPPPPGAPTYPGLEIAGVVVAVGANVTAFRAGDRVCALLHGGGYAEYCAVDVAQVLPIPGELSMVEAASLPETYFTVWSNVFLFGRLKGDETLLVHGGASGIGVAAIQLASARGHTVFATAGSEEKCRFCEQLGARRAIDYKREDFVQEIAAQTDRRGVDVILDMVGGSYLPRNIEALATEGRLVVIATQGGSRGELNLPRIMQKRLTVTGSLLRPRSVDFKGEIRDQLLSHVWPLIASKRIKPIVDRVFALEEAHAAHTYLESGAHKGKVILKVREL